MNVKVIPASTDQALRADNRDSTGHALRVAAYCRVSTGLADQESSYEAQCAHYEKYIRDHNGWELAGIYADEGISGTETSHREEFRRLISDCEKGRIDLVLTKSISRFARNTLDCLKYIRKLKAWNIPIYFEKESINTLDTKGEILITIMASIAQQESQSISQNVRMGIQYRFAQGKVMVNHNQFLGYTKDAEGNLVIVPEEARIVRRIFREFLDGFSPLHIARRLEKDGILTGPGRRKWYESTVRSILQNEKYMGDLVLQKYYTVDFMTKKIARNTGQLPQYYVENNHDPIIPKSVFSQVQSEFQRRSHKLQTTGHIEHYGSRMALGGRLICSLCGSPYRRYVKKDVLATDWRCRKRTRKGSPCQGRIIKETEAQRICLDALNMLPKRKEELIRLQERLMWGPVDRLNSQLSLYEEEARKPATADSQYISQTEDLTEQRKQLLMERARLASQEVQITNLLELIHGIEEYDGPTYKEDYLVLASPACYSYLEFFERTRTETQAGPVTEFRDAQIIRYVDYILVKENSYEVHFKAGITVELQ